MDRFGMTLSDAIVQSADEQPFTIRIDMATDDPDFLSVRIDGARATESLGFCASPGLLRRLAAAILEKLQ